MFDMTNDSHLFRTAAQLEDDGFYPVQGNRWKKGDELYLPLYEGRKWCKRSITALQVLWLTRRI